MKRRNITVLLTTQFAGPHRRLGISPVMLPSRQRLVARLRPPPHNWLVAAVRHLCRHPRGRWTGMVEFMRLLRSFVLRSGFQPPPPSKITAMIAQAHKRALLTHTVRDRAAIVMFLE